jgi:hypothetical protein
MVVLRNALKTDSTKAKTRRTTKSKGGKRARRESPSRKDGAERLRQAANKRLNEISETLADLLKKKALEGDLASAKTLFGLAAGKKPIPEPVKKQRGLTHAQRLAREPQWVGEPEGLELGYGDGSPF